MVACRKPKTRSAAEWSSPSASAQSTREHHGDLMRRGYQAIQRGVASRTEGAVTGRTSESLDAFGLAMLAIANQRVDVSSGNAKVGTVSGGTGIALGLHSLGCSPAAFHFTPGTHRNRCWSGSRGGSGGQTTSRAIVWRAGLEQTLDHGMHCSS